MRHLITTAALALGIAIAGSQPAAASTSTDTATDQYAVFEGEVIDMSTDRGDAVACAITETGNRCYRSEAEMDRNEQTAPAARAGSCSSSVRLYSGTGHSGKRDLDLRSRHVDQPVDLRRRQHHIELQGRRLLGSVPLRQLRDRQQLPRFHLCLRPKHLDGLGLEQRRIERPAELRAR